MLLKRFKEVEKATTEYLLKDFKKKTRVQQERRNVTYSGCPGLLLKKFEPKGPANQPDIQLDIFCAGYPVFAIKVYEPKGPPIKQECKCQA
jgi:hypothetical protein